MKIRFVDGNEGIAKSWRFPKEAFRGCLVFWKLGCEAICCGLNELHRNITPSLSYMNLGFRKYYFPDIMVETAGAWSAKSENPNSCSCRSAYPFFRRSLASNRSTSKSWQTPKRNLKMLHQKLHFIFLAQQQHAVDSFIHVPVLLSLFQITTAWGPPST